MRNVAMESTRSRLYSAQAPQGCMGRVPRGGVGTVDPRQDRVRVRQPWLAGRQRGYVSPSRFFPVSCSGAIRLIRHSAPT